MAFGLHPTRPTLPLESVTVLELMGRHYAFVVAPGDADPKVAPARFEPLRPTAPVR
jgi:hypothetical protein